MASNSCEAAERIENSIGVDRFSNLPDEIAHKIMKALSFKDLTCLGCVSKRCKNLQLSTPIIHLEHNGENENENENVGNMLDSFNNFMIQRGDNKIQKIEFRYLESSRLSAWINSAVRCNVEELTVQLSPAHDGSFTVPSALFLLGSLKSLSLSMKCVIGGEVSFSPSLSKLESLYLSSVSVIDESFWRWISSSCKRLQTLSLFDIYGSKNIIIESPSLKKVQISLREGCYSCKSCNLSISANRLEDISIFWGYTSSNNSVNIFAPKLKFLSWGGSFSSHINLGEMRFLNKALSKDVVTFAPLNEVRCLEVPCFFTDDLVPGLVRLLQRMPSLESLCLHSHLFACAREDALFNYGGFDMKFWKQQNLAFVDCLKNIAIVLHGGSIVFEFARYILKHARNLERMDIFCVPNRYNEVLKLQDEMISSGTLIFHQVMEDQSLYLEMLKVLKHFDK